ncbi:MAG: glycosyltransferase [Beijerinckiaceae bacterium]
MATLSAAAAPFFLVVIIVHLGASLERPVQAPPFDAKAPFREWPTYTVLIPLFREAAVACDLVECMASLDYPVDRLEILILLEACDHATYDALRAARPAAHIRLIVVPDGAPRTKPRALNYGLAMARGEYVTIYDAEDIPEPDQLKKAVQSFERANDDVMCFQARLAIDNGAESWLARMMQIEYAALFDVQKRGLGASAFPIPLGGTSNHLRRRTLMQLGGWDAWNVTEDADLGLRIARAGGHVADLDSTTFEEAPITLKAWMHQRTRWLKGWCQTTIVHTREPLSAIRDMGALSWLVAMAQVIGIVVSGLVFPFFTAYLAYEAISGELFDNADWLELIGSAIALTVAGLGGLTLLLPSVMGLRARREIRLWPWLLTLPAYLLLTSAAAWLAVVELVRHPFLWRKTEHGLSRRTRPPFRSTP